MPLTQPSVWSAAQVSVVAVAHVAAGAEGALPPAGAPPDPGAGAAGAAPGALPGAGAGGVEGAGAAGAALPTTGPGATDCTGSRPSSGFFLEQAARPAINTITASLFTDLSCATAGRGRPALGNGGILACSPRADYFDRRGFFALGSELAGALPASASLPDPAPASSSLCSGIFTLPGS